jgi:MarR family transcriptional regulator, lower aerobic nicotinate degradation pathway regulator
MKNIVELVTTYADFASSSPNMTVEDFCVRYLAEKVAPPTHESDERGIPTDGQLAGLIGKMNSFASLYCKKALENVGLKNIDDWVYLISLHEMGNPKKSELIYEMVSEFPSGIDIIKRLVNAHLVEETPDEEDKRSKRLKITPKGEEVLFRSFPYMDMVGKMAFSTMSSSEKIMITNVLKRLDNFHSDRYKNVRTASFEDAFETLTTH